jgi:hypothetical protein
VTLQGTAHGRFTHAVERRQLRGAEVAARELGRLSPADALALLLLIRDKEPHRAERAAARWVSLFLDAAGPMTLADIELTVVSLGALMRGSPSAAGVLASVAEAYRVPNVAGVLRRRRLG